MLDINQPHDVFSGKDDLYRLLRETRAAINLLNSRMESFELLLEDDMANTKGNSGMVPNSIGKKKRK